MPDISQMMNQMIVLIVGSTLLIIIGSFLIVYLFGRSRRKRAENLAATGVQGVANILSLEDTGMRINDNPRVKIGMQITLPGRAPYQLEKTMVLPIIRMSQVQPGATVHVMVDPNDSQNPNKVGLLLQ